jgi:hypothetical protein
MGGERRPANRKIDGAALPKIKPAIGFAATRPGVGALDEIANDLQRFLPMIHEPNQKL